jgi:hypothetical protein
MGLLSYTYTVNMKYRKSLQDYTASCKNNEANLALLGNFAQASCFPHTFAKLIPYTLYGFYLAPHGPSKKPSFYISESQVDDINNTSLCSKLI